ncbi:trypsin-like peptidase domain-containing protein [Vibrio diabolicus]|uniref:trypsin-like peptidase domain-containing protein n=1 Tax=Vibrio diabolicus TaxID=50719 RepID=UPI003752F12B
MSSEKSRELFKKYAAAVVYVNVELSNGDQSIGTAFHVGSGVFITARHVVDGTKILEVANTTDYYVPDESVDIAALIIEGIECPVIPLGSHLDDWINDEEFSLAQVVIMGYPPVPFSKEPTLISSRAEVNAVIDKYTGGHPHFIVSSIARGGFSGGPCLIEWNFALGVVTESLVECDGSPESGYMAVISIEPVYVCLSHHGIFPKEQAEGWNGFWDKTG